MKDNCWYESAGGLPSSSSSLQNDDSKNLFLSCLSCTTLEGSRIIPGAGFGFVTMALGFGFVTTTTTPQ
jgi:hypothetical protein